MTYLPFVSVIVPILNEVEYLPITLESLTDNGYPSERFEIIFIDGGSTDGSWEYLSGVSESQQSISIYKNQKRRISDGLNMGISKARGEIILRADAHAYYYPGYIINSVQSLNEFNAGSVGGLIRVKGSGAVISESIALAMNCTLGNGGVDYRAGRRMKYTDTVWCGCWRKETILSLGGFNEDWIINQDYEFNLRVRRDGKKILFNPQIRADYYARTSLRKFANQYFSYGMGRAKTTFHFPASIKVRQIAAFLPMIIILCNLFLLPDPPLLVQILLYGYLLLLISSSIACIIKSKKIMPCLMMPFMLSVMHVLWSSGFLKQLISEAYKSIRKLVGQCLYRLKLFRENK